MAMASGKKKVPKQRTASDERSKNDEAEKKVQYM